MIEPQNDNPLTPEEEASLDRLVRKTLAQLPDEGPSPDEAAVVAYVMGHATQAQKEEVHAALARSSSFRRRIADLVQTREETIEWAASPEANEAWNTPRPPPPADASARP